MATVVTLDSFIAVALLQDVQRVLDAEAERQQVRILHARQHDGDGKRQAVDRGQVS